MKLYELLRDTEALTYINALKVTQLAIKDEVAEIARLTEHLNESNTRVAKLVRRGDAQYRMIVKIATNSAPAVTNVTVSDDDLQEYEELMSDV